MDVYKLSIIFVSKANMTAGNLPKGRGNIADQLQRAALNVVLNIAEGAGKFSPKDKASYYTRARGSATQCAAVSDVCFLLEVINTDELEEYKIILNRTAQMLTRLIKSQ